MKKYDSLCQALVDRPRTWLITGVAGFIGSNLLEKLLGLGQQIVGLDNFMTGFPSNLDLVRQAVGEQAWTRFTFRQGDIRDFATCRSACDGIDHVLHQAALGSVPRSIDNPLNSHATNDLGFMNMLEAARQAAVGSMVYASSSSVYGDHPDLPKREDRIGAPLSPYSATKLTNEIYAKVFHRTYGLPVTGLRYFNVFGQRQSPQGAYAAVIPCWFAALIEGKKAFINGDGETSRDFCYIDNAVQANILAACADNPGVSGKAFNVACGKRTTLNQLWAMIRERVARDLPGAAGIESHYRDFRSGDVQHSLADISLAEDLLGYEPQISIEQGIGMAGAWYLRNLAGEKTPSVS